MGPKELMMVGGGLLVLTALIFVTKWANSRFGNGNNNGNTKTQA